MPRWHPLSFGDLICFYQHGPYSHVSASLIVSLPRVTGRHRKTATRAGIAGGALLILAGLGITAEVTLNGGPAGAAAALPSSCPQTTPTAVASAMASAAATQVRRASVATPAVTGVVTPLPGVAQGIGDRAEHHRGP